VQRGFITTTLLVLLFQLFTTVLLPASSYTAQQLAGPFYPSSFRLPFRKKLLLVVLQHFTHERKTALLC
jgi:hypothetical protein